MTRRTLAALAFLALATIGCTGKSVFESDEMELAYLQELSNPTPVQWNRRNELTLKFGRELEKRRLEQEASEIAAKLKAERDPVEIAARQRTEQENRGAQILALIERAEDAEGTNDPARAVRFYRDVARLARGTPIGQKCDARARELWRDLYGALPYEN